MFSKQTSGVTLAKASGRVTIKNGTSAARTVQTASNAGRISESLSVLSVLTLPSPSTTQFTLVVKSASNSGVAGNSIIRFGGNCRPGMYLVQVIQGSERATLTLIKQAN